MRHQLQRLHCPRSICPCGFVRLMYSSNSPRNLRDRVLHRPGGAVGQAADRRAGHDADRVGRPRAAGRGPRAGPGRADAVQDLAASSRCPRGTACTGRTTRGRRTGRLLYSTSTMLVWSSIDGDRRGAQAQAADLAGAVEVERRVELGGSVRKPMLMPPGIAAFALRPFQTPPPCSSISSRQVTPSGSSTQPGLFDVPAEAVQLRPVAAGVARVLRVGRHADRLEPVDAAVDDVRHAGQRLDVVDDRRLAERALDGRERRLDPRPGPLAFQALDQPRLLAADVRRRPRGAGRRRGRSPLPRMFLPSSPAA